MTTTPTPFGILARSADPSARRILATLGRYARRYDGWYLTVRRARMAETLVAAGATVYHRSGWYVVGGRPMHLYDAVAAARGRVAA